jgi:hypothetical protein
MNNSLIILTELKQILSKDFRLEDHLLDNLNDFEAIKNKLILAISHLLDQDLNIFLSICYRLDLKEEDVKFILTNFPVPEISSRLADLIFNREMEKVQTRIKYKNYF